VFCQPAIKKNGVGGGGAWEQDYFIQPSLELTFLPYCLSIKYKPCCCWYWPSNWHSLGRV